MSPHSVAYPAGGDEPATVRSGKFQAVYPNTLPVGEKLGAEESSAIRAQLIGEIETLPEDDLQPRAIAILRTKNRLSAEDAKRVEDAFVARMALQGVSLEALTADDLA